LRGFAIATFSLLAQRYGASAAPLRAQRGRRPFHAGESDNVPESLQRVASTLADYLSDTVLNQETLSTAYILEALASLDITLVGVGDSTLISVGRSWRKLWS